MKAHPSVEYSGVVHDRDSIDGDYEALFALHEETMRAYVEATYGAWLDDDQRRRFRDACEALRPRVLVDSGEIVAAYSIEYRTDCHFLSLVEVAARAQGKGTGAGIVQRFVDAARAAGVPATLQVLKANPRARCLYERLGFLVTGETATHHLMHIEP